MSKRADKRLEVAKQLAEEQRDALKAEWDQTRVRLTPARLKQDALDTGHQIVDDATEITVATVKEHPVIFGASFLGTLAFWYRKPLSDQIEQRTPGVLDSLGNALDHVRDWVAPEGWDSKRAGD